MKIVASLQNPELLSNLIQTSKSKKIELINAKAENVLFSNIEENKINYYILDTESSHTNKAISFIKKYNNDAIIYLICKSNDENLLALYKTTDFYIFYNESIENNIFSEILLHNIENLDKLLSKLYKLSKKADEPLKFGNAIYDPAKRVLTVGGKDIKSNGKEVKHLSTKQGGVLEILLQNINNVVSKELILDRVWHKNDYFSSRSLDVYITYIRKLFEENDIKYRIKNITGKGLILEKK